MYSSFQLPHYLFDWLLILNRMSLTKKVNTFIFSQKNQYPKQCKSQNTAKQSLIEISQVESQIRLQLSPSNNDVWNEKLDHSQEDSNKPVKYLRKTVPFRPSAATKYLNNKTCQDYQNIEDSIIPKLKKILRKLQSPEKKRNHQRRAHLQNIEENRREDQSWQPKIYRKNHVLVVENMFETKNSSIRKKNTSEKKSAKLLNYHKNDSPMRKVLSRQNGLNVRQFAEQIPLFRQARIKRTLKNILF